MQLSRIKSTIDKYTLSDLNTIDGLSKINIFVGANNSGKSRMLRDLYSINTLSFDVDSFLFSKDRLGIILEGVVKEIKYYLDSQGYKFKDKESLSKLNSSKLFENVLFEEQIGSNNFLNKIDIRVNDIKKIKVLDNVSGFILGERKWGSIVDELFSKIYSEIIGILDKNSGLKFKRIYIPMLRGLRPIGMPGSSNEDLYKDLYKRRTESDYFQDGSKLTIDSDKHRIFTGLSLFNNFRSKLLSKRGERDSVRAFEEYLGNTFFDGREVSLTPNEEDEVVNVQIGDDEELPIHKLGDGIQSIIILMYPLFFYNEENVLVFIEEPEMNLHPGMQRIFLETISQKERFKNFQFFFTTHSNHFLDMAFEQDDISIYSFFKNSGEEEVFNVKMSSPGDISMLDELGVRNSSVFLSNCTIWVEGISDRIYIRKYLELLEKDKDVVYKEGIHYSFVEYGGNNITHWSFLDEEEGIDVEKLCGDLFLISDRDGAGLKKDGTKDESIKAGKYNRHKQLEEKLGDKYYCLPVREVENLLAPNVLMDVIKSYESNNTSITFNDFGYDKYKTSKIGDFLNKNVRGRKRDYAKDSGTIKQNKVVFAKKAIGYMNSIDDISQDAKDLVERIYSFIELKNQ